MSTQREGLSEAFEQVVGLLGQLQSMRIEGTDATPEADAIRLQMEELSDELTDAQRRRADGISADLYMLSNEEIFAIVPAYMREQRWLGPRLGKALELGRHWRLLELLRHGAPYIAPANLAFLRAESYRRLGLFELSALFCEHAWSLQSSPDCRYQVVQVLNDLGHWERAVAHAKEILRQSPTDPYLLLAASEGLVQGAVHRVDGLPSGAAATAVRLCKRAIARIEELPSLPAGRQLKELAQLTLVMALQANGERSAAKRKWAELVAAAPDEPRWRVVRAMGGYPANLLEVVQELRPDLPALDRAA